MHFEIVSGICGILAVGEMAVFSVLDGSTSGEMLGDGGDGVLSKFTRAVEALDVGNDKLSGQCGVLAHRGGDPSPPGFGCYIDLRMQRRPDTDSLVFLSCDIRKGVYELSITNCCQA